MLVVSLLIDLREEAIAAAAPAPSVASPGATPAPRVGTTPVDVPAVAVVPPLPAPSERLSPGAGIVRTAPPQARPVVGPAPTAAPPSRPRGPTAPRPRSRSRGLGVAVLFGGKLSVPSFPGLAFAVRGGVELAPLPFLPIELGVAVWLPAEAQRAGAGATFLGGVARAGACLVAHADVVELGGCAALEAGAVLATGNGLDTSLAPWRPWVALSLRARVGVQFGQVAVRIEPGLSVPFVRDEFVFFDGATPVSLHRPGSVAGTVDSVVAVELGS